ncbi:hypothetical protein P10VF_064 [Rhizobium phage vB_RleM_P10VF]|uniref:Uncharacterized protein n=1 Tax=Rhizobium phage vB_RleM_P10VF TaxID=1527770 RepID=A0A076YKI7_9CAUD|nr:hypothetical protein P10VF_064 [Rhizobium phage vB_RleM_P10VF]AIK68277.1 hypothetical protein P10VF_064 [Rhizobium phage vB_RleM_P10VF]
MHIENQEIMKRNLVREYEEREAQANPEQHEIFKKRDIRKRYFDPVKRRWVEQK